MLDLSWLWDDSKTADVNLALVPKEPVAVVEDAPSCSNGACGRSEHGGVPDMGEERRGIVVKTEPVQPTSHTNEPLIVGHKRKAACEPGGKGDQPSQGSVTNPDQQQMLRAEAVIPPLQVEHMLHSTIIASASAYFKRQLAKDTSKDTSGTTKCKFYEDVDADQVEAAGAVLELMYKHKLPAGLDMRMMLSMLQVPACGHKVVYNMYAHVM